MAADRQDLDCNGHFFHRERPVDDRHLLLPSCGIGGSCADPTWLHHLYVCKLSSSALTISGWVSRIGVQEYHVRLRADGVRYHLLALSGESPVPSLARSLIRPCPHPPVF